MKTKNEILPVILCGGLGSRLWPLSRMSFPKQFSKIIGDKSLFQTCVSRFSNYKNPDFLLKNIFIVANEEHRFFILDQIKTIKKIDSKVLLEPISKNTAPALTFAALEAIQSGNDPIMIVLPSDQIITNDDEFFDGIKRGLKVAKTGSIVTFGIKPTNPSTGFGYIKKNGPPGKFGEYEVESFTEKPNIEVAKNYFKSKNFFWNSGIFIVKSSVWLDAIKLFKKNIFDLTYKSFKKKSFENSFVRPSKEIFSLIENISIDYAVLEHCTNSFFKLKTIDLNIEWKDIGSWDAIWELEKKDENNNLLRGDVYAKESYGNLIFSNHRLVSTLGINNLNIVETSDAILISSREKSQEIKSLVDDLDKDNREEAQIHRKVFRPWGWYDTIDIGVNFKVKRIQVNPGASLSLQKHKFRSEHWVVVTGVATIINGDNKFELKKNESTYIAVGVKHRLSNFEKIPLEIIEVQTGTKVIEEDIIRYEDSYFRG